MLNLKQALIQDIEAGIAGAQEKGAILPLKKKVKVVVQHNDEKAERGDYASPFALVLAKQIGKAPSEILEAVIAAMPKKEYLGKLEAAEPGFLNMRLNPGWMTARLNNVIEQDPASEFTLGQGKSVNLEFISANPTGPLTLANARTAFSADTLGNIFSCVGYNVTREYYVNDAGGQVKKLGQSVLRRILQLQGETIEFPADLYQGEYITDLAKHIAEEWREDEGRTFTIKDLGDEAVIQKISDQTVTQLLTGIRQIVEQDLRVHFDVWTSEKHLRSTRLIEKTLDRLRKAGHTYKKDGAEYLKTTAFGDSEDRVLVKADGEYAYIAPDIGFHQSKYDREFDFIFTFLGADHQGHIPKVTAAMQALGNDVTKLHFIVAQWFRLVRAGQAVKISKRAGMIVTPKDLIQEVGYDAARFFLVRHRLDTHMDFDLDLAAERSERNPVYYVQYAYVRLESILRRAKEQGVIAAVGLKVDMSDHPPLTHTLEVALMRELYRFPEVMMDIAQNFAVHELAYYARELAKAVHVFYKHVPVLKADEKLRHGRIELVLATRAVLGKVLDLLGIAKLEVM